MVGLDEFTGAKWQPSRSQVSRNDNDAEDGLPLPPGLGGATERHLRHYSIEIFDFSQAWLPLPYPTRKVIRHRRHLALRPRHVQRVRREQLDPADLLQGRRRWT